MNLRMTGLGAAVAVAALLPFVATAGPAAGPEGAALAVDGGPGPAIRPMAPLPVPLSGAGAGPGPAAATPGTRRPCRGRVRQGGGGSRRFPRTVPPGLGVRCVVRARRFWPKVTVLRVYGLPALRADPQACRPLRPPLVSPGGVEAQTCVLTEGAETWGRTYYRNTSGEALRAVLSLMGPAGRTVRTHCAIPRGDEPGACETPREKGRGPIEEYVAVAEFAADGDPESPLLLRSGSNPAPPPRS